MSELNFRASDLSELKDPFRHDCITAFHIHGYAPHRWREAWEYRGSIEFTNGNTKGEQKFEAETLADLNKKMELFVKELENQQ